MGGGPIGPFLPAFNYLADPEQLRRIQPEEQRLKLEQLVKDMLQMKAEREQRSKEEQAQKLLDTYIQIVSATFDKGLAYTHLLIAAGYGAFFGLWSLTKDDLHPILTTIAAILTLLSAACFVFYEIYRMVCSANMMNKLGAIVRDPKAQKDAIILQNKMTDLQKEGRKLNVSYIRSWRIQLFVCIGTGAGGVLLLLASFLYRLVMLLLIGNI